MSLIDDTIDELRAREASLRCHELKAFLEKLGYEIRDGKKGNHKTVTHPHIPAFFGSSFDCGHGKNPEINKRYVSNMRKLISQHKEELQVILGIKND